MNHTSRCERPRGFGTIVARASLMGGLIALIGGGMPPGAVGQTDLDTGEDVFNAALDRYEARMQGVGAYTVVQEFMGFNSTTHWVPENVSGHRVFSPRRSETGVAPGTIQGAGAGHLGGSSWDDPFRHYTQWGRAAVLEGELRMAGRRMLRVRVNDFGDANFGLTPGTFAEGHFQPRSGWFLFGADDLLLYRVEAVGSLQFAGQSRVVTVVADIGDYRTVGGMVHPFTIDLGVTGLGTTATREEQNQARRRMEELRAQIEELRPDQRASLEGPLNEQIDRLRGITEGRLTMSLQVTDLQVEPTTPGR